MLSEDLQSLEVYINKMKDKCVSPTGRGAVAGGVCGPGGCSGDLLELHMCECKAPSQSLTAGLRTPGGVAFPLDEVPSDPGDLTLVHPASTSPDC